MSKQKEDKITEELLSSDEYKVLQSSIESLHSALLVIQGGIYDEIQQVNSLNKMIKAQENIISYYKNDQTVDINYLRKAIKDRNILIQAADHKSQIIKSLNGYLTERIVQMDLLTRKMKHLISIYNHSNIIPFRGNNVR